jgi:hydrogenase maturation protein HypF
MHGAFCLVEGDRAFLSPHVGDLDTEEAMRAYRDAVDRARRVFGIEPALVAHDLHPDLMTTRFAEELGLPRTAVQHHHAHVVATMAEHRLDGDVLGIAFDGLGYGPDGTIWGGEFLRCSPSSFRRMGRLRPVRQPGGDAATRHPWRMALSHAADAGAFEDVVPSLHLDEQDADIVTGQLRSGLASPFTSSAGRLFDAVAALLGLCRDATYDGQAPMLLEQAARAGAAPFAVGLAEVDGLLEIDTRDLIAAVVHEIAMDEDVATIAGRFHASLAAATAEAAVRLAGGLGLDRVVLGGGVFANDLLATDLAARLTGAGLQVFLPREVPVGDGGIALGQAVVAAARDGEG